MEMNREDRHWEDRFLLWTNLMDPFPDSLAEPSCDFGKSEGLGLEVYKPYPSSIVYKLDFFEIQNSTEKNVISKWIPEKTKIGDNRTAFSVGKSVH